MTSIGIRELRQRASEVLRRVEAGETVEVTDRGRPVALLTPVPQTEGLERLRADGEATPPQAPLDTLAEPLTVPKRTELPSAVLARLRRDER
jgi:prevent-host-death family protein